MFRQPAAGRPAYSCCTPASAPTLLRRLRHEWDYDPITASRLTAFHGEKWSRRINLEADAAV